MCGHDDIDQFGLWFIVHSLPEQKSITIPRTGSHQHYSESLLRDLSKGRQQNQRLRSGTDSAIRRPKFGFSYPLPGYIFTRHCKRISIALLHNSCALFYLLKITSFPSSRNKYQAGASTCGIIMQVEKEETMVTDRDQPDRKRKAGQKFNQNLREIVEEEK